MYVEILIIKIFLAISTEIEAKQSSVIPKAEIASISQMDCSSRIPEETVTSKHPDQTAINVRPPLPITPKPTFDPTKFDKKKINVPTTLPTNPKPSIKNPKPTKFDEKDQEKRKVPPNLPTKPKPDC